jgi:lipopolysaccharide/colanic/teichoic acid biosynthesis glycosyltransferase
LRWAQGPKRFVDFVFALTALCALSPVLAVAALAVRISMGRPVLFRQTRPGLREKPFNLLKFRTMREPRGNDPELNTDSARLTAIGALLRMLSIDELPQLWNVVKGEMSLVGPRPLLVEYLPHYSAEQHRRHAVRPGMTGLAQVFGRNHTTWEERLAYDVFYSENCTMLLDLQILLRTLVAVFQGDGGTDATEKLGRFRGTGSPPY